MNSGNPPKLRLFNTASKRKQDFEPLDKKNVRVYVCGPTVYDCAHIGNARPAIVFDVLFRLLRHVYGKEHVTYVRNITDVDDKINARAVDDFPGLALNEAIRKLTQKTEVQYQKDMKALGCLEPSLQPRATEHIGAMIEMIEVLLAKGNAYVAQGHVLFAVKSYEKYGALARRSLDDMIAGARIEVAPYKRDPMDFVMWKPSADNEPGWDSPWGNGRPGWHIECSAMSRQYLGQVFDIHGGGIDLSFPHHENELAQSCCANDTDQMAQIWMHNGFLQVEGEKMSKSLGNFITVDELLNTEKFGGRKWAGNTLRLAMLMTNYRDPIDFSLARLKEAQAQLVEWSIDEDLRDKTESVLSNEFLDAISDDLNMPKALTVIRKHWKDSRSPKSSKRDWKRALSFFLGALDFLNLDPSEATKVVEEYSPLSRELEDKLLELIKLRINARNEKNWTEADKIRDQIRELGFVINDVKDDAGNIVPRLIPVKWER